MKTIIAGGRDYFLNENDYLDLDNFGITEVVSGACKGVDSCGEAWAFMGNIPVKIFNADWTKHGRAAGPIRNREMAQYADQVILFPGGRGTQSMYNEAKKAGIKIVDRRD